MKEGRVYASENSYDSIVKRNFLRNPLSEKKVMPMRRVQLILFSSWNAP